MSPTTGGVTLNTYISLESALFQCTRTLLLLLSQSEPFNLYQQVNVDLHPNHDVVVPRVIKKANNTKCALVIFCS